MNRWPPRPGPIQGRIVAIGYAFNALFIAVMLVAALIGLAGCAPTPEQQMEVWSVTYISGRTEVLRRDPYWGTWYDDDGNRVFVNRTESTRRIK